MRICFLNQIGRGLIWNKVLRPAQNHLSEPVIEQEEPVSADANKKNPFPLSEARAIVRDLNTPNPWIYWSDFFFHVTLGWAAFIIALEAPAGTIPGAAAFVISAVALYRAVIFTHELAHLKKGTFKIFRLAWNITCGFPLMVPSFLYHGVHNDHHARDIYGTVLDGEYLPFASQKPINIITYLLLIFVLPIVFAGRFLILAPLSWLNGTLARLVWERGSSLTIDLAYCRPAFSKRDDRTWHLQEVFSFLYAWTAAALVATGVWPIKLLALWYGVTLLIFFLNSLRTLAAHSYRNPGDQIMSVAEQYLDSVDVPGNNFLTPLWAPVGLRYHATHHLFPNMPYHALGKAHRRLVGGLTDNTLYLQSGRSSLWDALRRLWREAALATSD